MKGFVDDGLPFMNYRAYSCPECGRTLRLAVWEAPLVMRERCVPCEWYGTPRTKVAGGMKGAALTWNESPA